MLLNKTRDVTIKATKPLQGSRVQNWICSESPITTNLHSEPDVVCRTVAPLPPSQVRGLFGFWRQLLPHLKVLFLTFYQTTCKAVCFKCGPEQKALQLVPAALPLSLTTWQFQRCQKYLRQISWVMKPLSNTNSRVTEWPPRNWEQSHALFQHNHSCFEKEQPACYWAPVETACLSRGHWVTVQSGQPIMNTKP